MNNFYHNIDSTRYDKHLANKINKSYFVYIIIE